MNKKFIVIGLFTAVSVWVLPVSLQAQTLTPETDYQATLIQLIEVLQKQIFNLQRELDQRSGWEREQEQFQPTGNFSSAVDIIKNYTLTKQSEVENISNQQHREYFSQVLTLFPSEYAKDVRRLLVFTDEGDRFDAFVETLPPQHENWLFAVSEEVVETGNAVTNTGLIIHELAHIISYEEIIGLVKPTNSHCEDYFKKRNCPAENSYLKQFTDKFWSDKDLGRVDEYSLLGDGFESAYDYYSEHKNEYVTDYAAISPEEDFAESLMFFVLGNQAQGWEAKQKIEFFTQYPELVQLAGEVRSRL